MLFYLFILMTVMYLGTLFLCIYALKQWQKCLISWTESEAECQKLEDSLDDMAYRYCDYEDRYYDIEDGEEAPDLIPFDLLDERAGVPWEEIRGPAERAPNLEDIINPRSLI